VAASRLPSTPDGFVDGDKALRVTEQQLSAAIETGRADLAELGEIDPVTQDLVIGIVQGLEKHLWMVQAQLACRRRRVPAAPITGTARSTPGCGRRGCEPPPPAARCSPR
jgi:hypothetical protein